MFGGGVPFGAIHGGRRRGGGTDPWFLMLAFQLYQQIERLGPDKPALTLGFMCVLASSHFGVFGMLGLPSPLELMGVYDSRDACLSPIRIFSLTRKSWTGLLTLFGFSGNNSFWSSFKFTGGEWHRIVTSPFVFGDDVHLVINLSSFLFQGARLERKFGPARFAKFLLIIFLATQIAFVALAETLRRLNVLDVTRGCIVGISGLNFATKTYLSITEPGPVQMWGFIIPGKFATIAELGVIHLLHPHAPSLVYHATGALVGAYAALWEGHTFACWRYVKQRTRVFRQTRSNTVRPDPPPGVREANERAAAGGASSGFGRFLVLPFGVRRRRGNANGATPADLKPGTRVVLAGLNAAAMNGSWGTVAGPDAKTPERVRVKLDGGAEFSVLPGKCVVVDADGR